MPAASKRLCFLDHYYRCYLKTAAIISRIIPPMNPKPAFAKYAWFVLGWNILVILWGVFLRASKSGDGCGQHWLTCQGEVIPSAPQLKTIIEFSHRVTSSLAGHRDHRPASYGHIKRWRNNRTPESSLTLKLAVGFADVCRNRGAARGRTCTNRKHRREPDTREAAVDGGASCQYIHPARIADFNRLAFRVSSRSSTFPEKVRTKPDWLSGLQPSLL